MAEAKPKVRRRRRRKREQNDDFTRTERARADTHRSKRSAEQLATGRWTPRGRGQSSEQARKVAQARRQPRDPLARFEAHAAHAYEELIFGPKKARTYPRSQRYGR